MTPHTAPRGRRVLIISHERLGPKMAGPAIRCWELARALADEFQVTLAAPGGPPPDEGNFEWLAVSFDDKPSLAHLEELTRQGADVVVASQYLIHRLPFLRQLDVPLVADAYVPQAVESLAWHVGSQPEQQARAYRYSWDVTRSVARYADLLLCASERQRDFWLGVLAAYGRLRPELYAADPHLHNLVAIVPFGCPAQPPRPRPVLRGVYPGLEEGDQVILWNGGVWNWFDPLTLLRAMPRVLERHPRARLVFMGANHPDPERVPQMARARQARDLSRELGLEGRAVFWGDWVPYAERGAYLLEADVGVSLHHAGAEARLAFRTRLLDAIWAGLPLVLTAGDVLGDELAGAGAAVSVEPGAVEEVAQALNALLDERDTRAARRAAFQELRTKYAWQRVTEPLRRFCQAPHLDVGKQEVQSLLEEEAQSERAALEAEIARLEELVRGYESGRVMRMLAAMDKLLRHPSGE